MQTSGTKWWIAVAIALMAAAFWFGSREPEGKPIPESIEIQMIQDGV